MSPRPTEGTKTAAEGSEQWEMDRAHLVWREGSWELWEPDLCVPGVPTGRGGSTVRHGSRPGAGHAPPAPVQRAPPQGSCVSFHRSCSQQDDEILLPLTQGAKERTHLLSLPQCLTPTFRGHRCPNSDGGTLERCSTATSVSSKVACGSEPSSHACPFFAR